MLRVEMERFQHSVEESLCRTELTVVIPCYNEEEVLPLLKERLFRVLQELGLDWEVVFVDDGSRDATLAVLTAMHWEDQRFKVVALSRNFGQQAAISAGLAYASGEVVAIMDADLQDPPELLAECLRKLTDGYDVVYAVRRQRKEGMLKRAAYWMFYRLLRLLANVEIPADSGDFCAMNRRVADVLRQMPERDAFIRGLRAWVGFRQIGVEYERLPRAAGQTKYSFGRMMRFASDGIFSFSVLPLRAAIGLGICAMGMAVGWAGLHLVWRIGGFRLMGHTAAELPGWTTLMCGILLLGGLQLLLMGCVGEYVGRIYMEIKQRPKWVVSEALGIMNSTPHPNPLPSTGERENWLQIGNRPGRARVGQGIGRAGSCDPLPCPAGSAQEKGPLPVLEELGLR